MTTLIVAFAAGAMLALAVLMAIVLGWANKAFHVETNPLVEKALDILPGANCGGCGFLGCAEYAEAVVAGDAPPTKCPVGGEGCAKALAKLLGLSLEEHYPYRAVVHCGAKYSDRLKHNVYHGEQTCRAANLVSGVQGCAYGCLGLGDCEQACPFDAIHVIDGLATVDYDKCTGCGACERACPRHIISMVPFKADRMPAIACSNLDFGKDVKAVCKVGCTGCGMCARISEIFTMEDKLARVNYDKYDPEKMDEYEAAMAKCPMKRIVYFGQPSAEDLAAVADEEAPPVAEPAFETTVDHVSWWG